MNKYEKFWEEILSILNFNNDNINLMISNINLLIEKYFNSNIFVEISNTNINEYEIVFCWWHSKDNIRFIKEILKYKPLLDNRFTIIWPKPWLWFEFSIKINGLEIEASKFLFYPLKNDKNNDLWISLYLDWFKEINNDIIWKIIETWIWEDKASIISYLEYEKEISDDYLNIEVLDNYIDWHLNKKNLNP